jgi:AraC-like DNA-binding protein
MDTQAKVVPLHLHPLGFIEAFTQHGAHLEPLLSGTGVTASMLERRDVKISYRQQKALIENGLRLCQKPGLGLLVGSEFDWSYYGPVGAVVHCAPSLREAGEAVRHYLMLSQPYYAAAPRRPATYVDANGMLVEPFQSFPDRDCPNAQLREFEMEFRLSMIVRLWDACGAKSVPDASIHVGLDYPEPAHGALYRRLPLTTIRFGCNQCYVAAHKRFVLEPFRPLRRPAFERVIEQCERELRLARLQTSYSAQVRWRLMSHYHEGLTLERVAKMLGMTSRALTRRLAAEKTKFRDIAHEVRMELTAYHLRKSRLNVDEIAELLGFSSASSLRRALRNWSGAPAGEVRRASAALAPHSINSTRRSAPTPRSIAL